MRGLVAYNVQKMLSQVKGTPRASVIRTRCKLVDHFAKTSLRVLTMMFIGVAVWFGGPGSLSDKPHADDGEVRDQQSNGDFSVSGPLRRHW
jgi:hypothetical protein